MKKVSICLLASALAFGVIYLIGAFISVSFDISQWWYFLRVMVALLGFMISCLVFDMTNDAIKRNGE